MRHIAYFLADTEIEDHDIIVERAKQRRMKIRDIQLVGDRTRVEESGTPCLHYILGIHRGDYAIEAESPEGCIGYAHELFLGLSNAFISFRGFVTKAI